MYGTSTRKHNNAFHQGRAARLKRIKEWDPGTVGEQARPGVGLGTQMSCGPIQRPAFVRPEQVAVVDLNLDILGPERLPVSWKLSG